MKRAAIYIRISTRNQEAANQLIQLREYVSRAQLELTAIYQDVVSGGEKHRPHFEEMMQDASQRKFDILVFWALDRLSREGVGRTVAIIEQLDGYGIELRSHTETYLNNMGVFRDVILGLLATLAKQERVRISERTIAGLERARRAGRFPGRPLSKDFKHHRTMILHLRENANLSFSEIAQKLSLPSSTVHAYYQRAKGAKIENGREKES